VEENLKYHLYGVVALHNPSAQGSWEGFRAETVPYWPDKLHKVRPLIEQLNNNICVIYHPSKTLSVDESMIPFKGRSSLKQYMPMKPVKRGYKVWCLADSKTGYILKFEVYTGKSETGSATELTLGERIVSQLTSNLTPASLVAFDNFFTTVNLLEMLRSKDIYAVGTVRVNRRGLPAMMKEKEKLSRGEFTYRTKGNIAAIKWMDNKPVTMLTSSSSPRTVERILRRNRDGTRTEISCPKAVATYNRIMGGVDKFDQLRERYAIGRRSVKWWHRIFYYLIDLAIVNAFVMWKLSKRTGSHDQLTFRIRLARQLIGNFSNRKRKGKVPSFMSSKKQVPDDVRLANVGVHIPSTGLTYRRCRHCSTRKVEKRTRCLCTTCSVPLCLDPCFRQFHTK